MKTFDNRIGETEVFILIVASLIGTGIMTLPARIIEVAGPDAWLSIMIAGAISLLVAVMITHTMRRFPRQTLVQFLESSWGRVAARTVGGLYSVHFVMLAAISLRAAADHFKLVLLPRTPVELIVVGLMVVSVYLAREGLEPIARMFTILLPTFLLPFFLMLLALKNATYDNLLPFMNNGVGPVFRGAYVALFSFAGFEGLFIWAAAMPRPQGATRAAVKGVGLVWLIYLWVIIATAVTFTPQQVKHLQVPVKAVIDTIDLPLLIFERFDVVLFAVWIGIAVTTIIAIIHLATRFLQDTVGFRTQTPLAFPLVPIIFTLALLPEDIIEVQLWTRVVEVASAISSLAFPFLLWIFVRDKGRKSASKAR